MKILVIEDNEVLLKTVEFKFKKEGFTTYTANNGKEAIKKIAGINPDLIITDINMPFMSGLEVISFIRNELNSKVPIIVLSSVGLEKTVLEAFALGATDYITKPFSPNELLTRVHKLLPKNVPQDEIPLLEARIEEDKKKKIEEIRATIEALLEQEKKLLGKTFEEYQERSKTKLEFEYPNPAFHYTSDLEEEIFVPRNKTFSAGETSNRFEDDEIKATKARIKAMEEKEDEENKLYELRKKVDTLNSKLTEQSKVLEREEEELFTIQNKIKELRKLEEKVQDNISRIKSKLFELKEELKDIDVEENKINARIEQLRIKIRELRDRTR